MIWKNTNKIENSVSDSRPRFETSVNKIQLVENFTKCCVKCKITRISLCVSKRRLLFSFNWGYQADTISEYVFWFFLPLLSYSSLDYVFEWTPLSVRYHGGSWKILFTDGCCCIRCHFLIRISLRFWTAGWYRVTKDKIRFLELFLGGGPVSSLQS